MTFAASRTGTIYTVRSIFEAPFWQQKYPAKVTTTFDTYSKAESFGTSELVWNRTEGVWMDGDATYQDVLGMKVFWHPQPSPLCLSSSRPPA